MLTTTTKNIFIWYMSSWIWHPCEHVHWTLSISQFQHNYIPIPTSKNVYKLINSYEQYHMENFLSKFEIILTISDQPQETLTNNKFIWHPNNLQTMCDNHGTWNFPSLVSTNTKKKMSMLIMKNSTFYSCFLEIH